MEFKDRLIQYRKSLKVSTQSEMAKRMEVNRQYYSNIESGYKKPSSQFIEKLSKFSGKPEYYWIYGIDDRTYADDRREFKCLYSVIDELKGTNFLELDEKDRWTPEIENILLTALKADILHMHLKLKENEKQEV